MIKVEIKGLEKLKIGGDKSIQWKEIFRQKIGEEMKFFGEAVVGTSREKFLSGRPGLNVRTGRLRSSINYLVKGGKDGFTMNVGTNVVYAATHEFGSRDGFIRPRPFLKPAVESEYDGLIDKLDQIIAMYAEHPIGE